MITTLFAETARLPGGWAHDVTIGIGGDGRIAEVQASNERPRDSLAVKLLLPAPSNLHSHTFQRAMAGLAEQRSPEGRDSFWSWRDLMYRFVGQLDPEDVEAIAALAFVEMMEAGYAGVGEFHYLHHGPGGTPYDDPAELSVRIFAAAEMAGLGLTHLPVLYQRGGMDDRALDGGQLRFGHDLDDFAALIATCDRLGRAGAERGFADTTVGLAPHSLRAVDMAGPAGAMLRELQQTEMATTTGHLSGLTPRPVHIHLAEQTAEVDAVRAATGLSPYGWLSRHAEIDPNWCLIHATHMTPAELDDAAHRGAVVGLCPITESNLGDGIFLGEAYAVSGGRWGVGTDSNVRIGFSEELRTLEYGQRLAQRARTILAPPGASNGSALFDMAVEAGAQAIGRNSGAIRSGAWGDLLALDLDLLSFAGQAGDRLLDAWVFAAPENAVQHVWSAGRHRVVDGRHVARDAIEARYRTHIARLMDAL